MSIARLRVCEWSGNRMKETTVDAPSWARVEKAIRALNGEGLNDLYLQPESNESETYLCVGGGAGRYVVSGSIRNEEFPTLVNETKHELETVTLTVGGQAGDYPANWVVDLPTALAAARDFFEVGSFEGETKWVRV